MPLIVGGLAALGLLGVLAVLLLGGRNGGNAGGPLALVLTATPMPAVTPSNNPTLAQVVFTTTSIVIANVIPTDTPLPTAAPVAAQPISVTVTESATVNTTAHRDEPIGNDSTTLKIVNAKDFTVTIAAGTQVYSGGVAFVLPNAVVVPATNLLAGSIGTTYAKVTATSVGPSGVAAFTMAGKLGAVSYLNTDDAKGGYVEHIATVSEADYDNLVNSLKNKVNARILDEINAQVHGRVLITQTVTLDGKLQVSADHKVGDDATSLTVSVTQAAHAYTQ